MKIQITTIMILIGMISLVSAIDIYSGQDYIFESEQFDYFEVIGNQSSIDGMNITWDNGNTTISFDRGFVSDSFILVLFNTEKEIITKHVYSGGGGSSGGSRTVYRDRNVTVYEPIEGKSNTEIITETVTDTQTIIENKTPGFIWVFIGILIVGLIVSLIMYFKKGESSIGNEG